MSYNITSIKELRKSEHKTQKQISDQLGMSVRNYREKEGGKLPFTQLEMMKLINLFNLEKDDLFQIFFVNGFKTIFWLNDSLNNQYK